MMIIEYHPFLNLKSNVAVASSSRYEYLPLHLIDFDFFLSFFHFTQVRGRTFEMIILIILMDVFYFILYYLVISTFQNSAHRTVHVQAHVQAHVQ